jgi:superfamily II DNA or RNA helicase
MLLDWAGENVFRDGMAVFQRGLVREAVFEPPQARGLIGLGDRTIRTAFKVSPGGLVENLCPCRENTVRGLICMHLVALGLALCRRAADPEREARFQEERRKAERVAQADWSAALKRADPETPGAQPARLILTLPADWRAGWTAGHVPVECAVAWNGRQAPLDRVEARAPLAFDQRDDALLCLLEDVAEGPPKARLTLSRLDFLNLLNLHAGKPLPEQGAPEPRTVNLPKLASRLRVDLDPETGEMVLSIHTELPYAGPDDAPFHLVARRNGWVFGAGNFWPLENVLPPPLQGVYAAPVRVPRPAVVRFMQQEYPALAALMPVESNVSLDLFTLEPAEPVFRLAVTGSPASLSATLFAEYGESVLVAGKNDPAGHFAIPDPHDILRYLVRHPAREAAALERLALHGFAGKTGDALSHIIGLREVKNFLAGSMPALRRQGWKVEFQGRVSDLADTLEHVVPVVRVAQPEGARWFEIGFEYADRQGQTLSAAEVQRALLKGEYFLEKGGRTLLLDAGAIRDMNDVFADCAAADGSRPGLFRLEGVHAAYVQSSLAALDGVDVEAPSAWQREAAGRNRLAALEPPPLPESLARVLRPYQKTGVSWLRFLEANRFAGILADEMGLGKTLQTLAWLQMARTDPAAAGLPALIVCPTSLVENWVEESRRFVPQCRVMSFSGADRHARLDDIARHDIVVTSYALLRRDAERFKAVPFAVIVLDEAQHIKNRSTQNAIAAKSLQAAHRLVLTGTPIENSVADLWSIMDFLMPGYLGRAESFRQQYELPIARGGAEAEAAQARLRRKLQPFLLRRLKQDVAADLPPMIQKVHPCTLTPDQQVVYRELVESSRRRLSDLVAQQGFSRSRMEVLKTLMRLRQVCCHLDLLKLPGLESKAPSAKMDLFFELMDEALDAGHRVLVFSQFVAMLGILRRQFEQRKLAYCYLDGATQNRLQVVHEFNTNRQIPAFLISLKAGGTGLNLTGADMVVHFDPWWNPAVEDQASDRAHRIGQKRAVYCVKLITRGTVEEKVRALQEKKRLVIRAALASSDEQVMGKLTWEDVQDLLSL